MKKSIFLLIALILIFIPSIVYAGGSIAVEDAPTTPAANTLYTENIITAWVRFEGTTCTGGGGANECTIESSFNVDRVERVSAGDYKVYWKSTLANDDYAVLITSTDITSSANSATGHAVPTTTYVEVYNTNNGYWDDSKMSVMILGGN